MIIQFKHIRSQDKEIIEMKAILESLEKFNAIE